MKEKIILDIITAFPAVFVLDCIGYVWYTFLKFMKEIEER